jgi:transmembrane sensor
VTPSDADIRGAIAQQAGEWFVAHQTGSLDEESNAAFLAWLKASPVHVREYLGVARIANALPAAMGPAQVPLETFLAQQQSAASAIPLANVAPRRRVLAARRTVWAWALAASLFTLTAGLLWWAHDAAPFGMPKSYRTARGEQSTQQLPDGSILRLDTDSEVTVRYSRSERLVELRRGQALFAVVHDAGRRFRVTAGRVGAIALGTRFNVYKKSAAVEITVAEGTIAVFGGIPSWLRTVGQVPPQVLRVTASQQVRIDDIGRVTEPADVDLNQTLGWLQHQIVFEDRPLGEVATEFSRYGNRPVDIEDAALRELRVSGMFDAGDTDSFIAFLRKLPGIRVEETAERFLVVRAIPAT